MVECPPVIYSNEVKKLQLVNDQLQLIIIDQLIFFYRFCDGVNCSFSCEKKKETAVDHYNNVLASSGTNSIKILRYTYWIFLIVRHQRDHKEEGQVWVANLTIKIANIFPLIR